MDTTRDTISVRRQELYALLGDLPERTGPPTARTIAEERHDAYVLETLLLDLNGLEAVPALFVRPRRATGRVPVVLYNHAHGGDYRLGKTELVRGRDVLQQPPYAQALAERGYGALCIDAWAFGDRRGRTESAIFKEMLWHGRVMWGMMVYDSLRAIDYLVTREDVDLSRLATLGLSIMTFVATLHRYGMMGVAVLGDNPCPYPWPAGSATVYNPPGSEFSPREDAQQVRRAFGIVDPQRGAPVDGADGLI